MRHVQILAALQTIQGALELIAGGFLVFFGLLGVVSPGGDSPSGGGDRLWVQLTLSFLGVAMIGAVVSAIGLLRCVAGPLSTSYRGRRLSMGILVIGLLSSITCCCLPTSAALCIYGLVVYTNKEARQAFALRMGANGNGEGVLRSPS